MNKKKVILDISFIVVTAIILIVLNEFRLIEKYVRFALIPILISYYLGQFIERKTRTNSQTENK